MSNPSINRRPMRKNSMQAGEKPKDFKKSMGKMIRYIGSYKFAVLLVMIFAIGSTIFNVIGPKILGKATTEVFQGLAAKIAGTGSIDFTRIGRILLFLLGLYALSAFLGFLQSYLMSGITQKVTFRMRKELSEKINRMPLGYFESRTYGEVLSRVTNDVDTLGQSMNQCVTQLITSVTTIIGVLVMMLSISPLMTLIALLILPLSTFLVGNIIKRSQKFFQSQQEYLGKVNGQVEEMFSGHNVVAAFNREERAIREFNEVNDQLYNSAWKSQFLSGLMQPLMTFVGNLGYVAVAILGGFLASAERFRSEIFSPLSSMSNSLRNQSRSWRRFPICSSPWRPLLSASLNFWKRRKKSRVIPFRLLPKI